MFRKVGLVIGSLALAIGVNAYAAYRAAGLGLHIVGQRSEALGAVSLCRRRLGDGRIAAEMMVLFEPQAPRFLCDVAGADRVVLGSDYPFPIGDPEPARVVCDKPLTAAERRAILGETAARIFHIDCSCIDDC